MKAVTLVPYTPTAVAAETLDARTVGRADVLGRLLAAARAATRSHDRRHTLLVAPRGGGKTHVLSVFAHRVRTDPELARALALVVVDEDAADVASYADLLVAILEHLAGASVRARARELRSAGRDAELERLVLETLGSRPLVLVLENLDRLFADFGTHQQRQLRALVETSRAIMLVASTPALFAAVRSQTQPWFGSFTVERLAPWDVQEGTAFLARIARDRDDAELAAMIESDVGRARLLAASKLVGGLPRLWTILAGCLTVELLDELVPLVLATLEELVPYYQARLNELAPNERKLVVALCRAESLGNADGRTVGELAVAAGVSAASAPKLLARLEDAGWVHPTKPPGTDRRATWYELREPLLRYHVAYRRQAGATLGVIVSFLRAWFSPARASLSDPGTLAAQQAAPGELLAAGPPDRALAAARALDETLAPADPSRLAVAAQDDADWPAIAHVLRWGAQGAGLSAVVRSVADAEIDGGRLARRLVQTAAPLKNGIAHLTTSILCAADSRPWERAELERWLARWTSALTDVPEALVATAALEAIGREAGGDSGARPSLPPELRDVVPRVRLATRVEPRSGVARRPGAGAARDLT